MGNLGNPWVKLALSPSAVCFYSFQRSLALQEYTDGDEDDDNVNASISVELGWARNRDLIRNETVQDVA